MHLRGGVTAHLTYVYSSSLICESQEGEEFLYLFTTGRFRLGVGSIQGGCWSRLRYDEKVHCDLFSCHLLDIEHIEVEHRNPRLCEREFSLRQKYYVFIFGGADYVRYFLVLCLHLSKTTRLMRQKSGQTSASNAYANSQI